MKYNTTQYVTEVLILLSDILSAEDGMLQLLISDPAVEYTPN